MNFNKTTSIVFFSSLRFQKVVITHFMLPVMMLVNYGLTHLKIATTMKKQEKSFWRKFNRDSGQVTTSGISKNKSFFFLLAINTRVNVVVTRTKKPGGSDRQK